MQMDGLKVLIFLPDSFRSRNLSMVRTESGPCSQSALSILAPGPIRSQYHLQPGVGPGLGHRGRVLVDDLEGVGHAAESLHRELVSR